MFIKDFFMFGRDLLNVNTDGTPLALALLGFGVNNEFFFYFG